MGWKAAVGDGRAIDRIYRPPPPCRNGPAKARMSATGNRRFRLLHRGETTAPRHVDPVNDVVGGFRRGFQAPNRANKRGYLP